MRIVFSLALLLMLVLSGCSANRVDTANQLNVDIHNSTDAIRTATEVAEGHIDQADQKIKIATTQPGAVWLLNGARQNLASAKTALAPISEHVDTIDTKADAAAAETEKAVTEKEKIQDGWGYRLQKFVTTIFWTLIILAPILGILAFVIKTNGGGPILAAVGEVIGNLISAVWTVIKFIGKAIYHVLTLGLGKLAEVTNKHYDAQEAGKKDPALVNPPQK